MKRLFLLITAIFMLAAIAAGPVYAYEAGTELQLYVDYSLIEGTSGRLYLPSINASVALYAETDAWSRQNYTDLEDGACVFDCYNCLKTNVGRGWLTAISDHRHQAFKNLPLVQAGDLAYVVYEGNVICVLQCTSTTYGDNRSYWFDLDDGTIPEDHPGYMMFTCAKEYGSSKIFVSFWEDITTLLSPLSAEVPGNDSLSFVSAA